MGGDEQRCMWDKGRFIFIFFSLRPAFKEYTLQHLASTSGPFPGQSIFNVKEMGGHEIALIWSINLRGIHRVPLISINKIRVCRIFRDYAPQISNVSHLFKIMNLRMTFSGVNHIVYTVNISHFQYLRNPCPLSPQGWICIQSEYLLPSRTLGESISYAGCFLRHLGSLCPCICVNHCGDTVLYVCQSLWRYSIVYV